MKKLSELDYDAMLIVKIEDEAIGVISKEGFCADYLPFTNNKEEDISVALGVKEVATIDFDAILEELSNDMGMHEDWKENVSCELEETIGLRSLESKIQKVFDNNPTYFEGEAVEIDMVCRSQKN